MEPAAIAIRRFASVYRCAPKSDAGLRLRDRLDTVARRGIAAQVETMAASLARGDDRSVWVIRQLAFSCVIDANWDDDRIARAWARRLVHALALELAAGGTDGVIRFDSPAARLARFLADLADGDAFGKWYNAHFAGLKALPASIALRTALADGGADGIEALRMMSEAQFQAVLRTLSAADALAVLRHFAAIDDAAPADLLAVAGRMPRRAPAYPPEDARWGLAVFVGANREYPDLARTLVQLAAAIALQARAAGATQRGEAPGGTGWPERLGGAAVLAGLPGAIRRQFSAVAPATSPGHTAFGGAFLLLPVLLAMPFGAWTRGWPPIGGLPADRMLRAIVLAICLGPGLLADPLWQELLGMDGGVDWHAIGAELGRLGPNRCGMLRRGLAAHAREHGDVPHHCKAVRAAGQTWRIDHDGAGYWHRIAAGKLRGQRTVADADLAYLAPRMPVALPPAWQRLLCVAAQQALRRFARRLPGFALSHLDYLHANFLCLDATVEMAGARVDLVMAGLGRPPLALMLNLAGMTRTEYALPWPPGRTCVLHTREA